MKLIRKNQPGVAPICARLSESLRQIFVLWLCLLTFGQTQISQAMAQEPASPQQAVPSEGTTASAGPAETAKHVESDQLPSAPNPQLALVAQQSQAPQQPTTPPQQSTEPQQPVGTAAAPYEKPTGVPGSRPAGAAIAPAKQRRVRAIVISIGLILAGAGAVGAVVGLSKASHSQP
jgi:hypothetical protein